MALTYEVIIYTLLADVNELADQHHEKPPLYIAFASESVVEYTGTIASRSYQGVLSPIASLKKETRRP